MTDTEELKKILELIHNDIKEMKDEVTQIKRHLKQVRKQVDKIEEDSTFMMGIYNRYESTIVFIKSKIDKIRKTNLFSRK